MKKILFLSLMFLWVTVSSYAASLGGVETQGQGKISIGFDQEFFNRNMEPKSRLFTEDIGDIEFVGLLTARPEIKMRRTMAKVSYGLLDNLDVYAKLGIAGGRSKFKFGGTLDWNDGVDQGQATLSGSGKYKTNNAFAYGFGTKGTYELNNDWFVGVDVGYLRHQNNYESSVSATYTETVSGATLQENYSWKGKLVIQEWQVSPYLAKRIGKFVPYAGVKYSDLRMKDKDEGVKYKADDNLGAFIGADYKLTSNLSLNVEGRFIDETAISFGCAYKF